MTLLVLLACTTETDLTWVQFNADDDALSIEVTAAEDLGDPVTTELFSTTGSVLVGSAEVTPGSGPVGTDHTVTVIVDDTFEEVVGRVTVEADAGDRGNDAYELRQDSADHGYWVADLTSLGEEGEARTDTFTVVLWNLEEVDASDLLDSETE